MTNPANPAPKRVTEATRIPMSLPVPRLEAPKITGYYLRWIVSTKIPRALRAGYEFVDPEEVTINNTSVANDVGESGSTDMGSRVSVSAGANSFRPDGQPDRLYLMKLREEWRQRDLEEKDNVSERIAQSLRAGIVGAENDPDKGQRYMKAGQDLFWRKTRRP